MCLLDGFLILAERVLFNTVLNKTRSAHPRTLTQRIRVGSPGQKRVRLSHLPKCRWARLCVLLTCGTLHASTMLWAGDDGRAVSAHTPALHAAVGTGATLSLDRRRSPPASTSYGEPVLDGLGSGLRPRLARRHGHIGARTGFASLTTAHTSGCRGGPPSAVMLPVIPLFASATASCPAWRRGQAQFVSLPIGVGSGALTGRAEMGAHLHAPSLGARLRLATPSLSLPPLSPATT